MSLEACIVSMGWICKYSVSSYVCKDFRRLQRMLEAALLVSYYCEYVRDKCMVVNECNAR